MSRADQRRAAFGSEAVGLEGGDQTHRTALPRPQDVRGAPCSQPLARGHGGAEHGKRLLLKGRRGPSLVHAPLRMPEG